MDTTKRQITKIAREANKVFDTGVVMIAYLAMLLFYDWKLTLLTMLFPPIAYFFAEKLKVTVTRNVALSRESNARLNADTLERVANALTYRVYGQETNRNEAYEVSLTDYEKKSVRANIWENAMQPIYQVISMLGTIMIIWFGGKNVFGTGWSTWNIAAFTTFFSCYQKLAVKSSKAAKLFNAIQKAQVSWKRIKPYCVHVAEEPEQPTPSGSTLSVEQITFAYPGQKPLFSNVTFRAEPGNVIGITGEIACGKSTLGKILIGELPYQGKISVGDIIFPNQGERYETCVGYLGHQPELFGGTIEENICLGKPGNIGPVLRAVCMEQEVEAFPEGIHTVIGNNGVRLSGGQQARIALAEGKQILFSMAIGYCLIVAISGLLDAVKESVITTFGQKVTHQIRSAMSEKLKHLPASYFIEREPGVTASRFVNDVNTVDNLFTSGIISMAADLCKLFSILLIIFTKSIGLGLILIVVTPLLFGMTRKFQKRMLNAQMENRIAVGRTNQQIPEPLKNMRTIRVLHQERYMLHRYDDGRFRTKRDCAGIFRYVCGYCGGGDCLCRQFLWTA